MVTKSKTQNNKKVVIKKRTAELTPTKASATAIASQALRAKKQEIREVESQGFGNSQKKTSTRIPTGIWIFFGCSLLLFCVSIYQAIFKPQIESDRTLESGERYWTSSLEENQGGINENIIDDISIENNTNEYSNNEMIIENIENDQSEQINNSDSSSAVLSFFDKISNKDFEGVNNLLHGQIKTSSEIREHFSEFRLSPFISGIVGNRLSPTNIQYISTSPSGNETYKFDLSYSLNDGQQFDETWTMTTKNVDGEFKIVSIRCETYRCSFHPIFWPENFGLME